jgi:hypothetical protein
MPDTLPSIKPLKSNPMPAKAPPNVFAIGLPEKTKTGLWRRLRRRRLTRRQEHPAEP